MPLQCLIGPGLILIAVAIVSIFYNRPKWTLLVAKAGLVVGMIAGLTGSVITVQTLMLLKHQHMQSLSMEKQLLIGHAINEALPSYVTIISDRQDICLVGDSYSCESWQARIEVMLIDGSKQCFLLVHTKDAAIVQSHCP